MKVLDKGRVIELEENSKPGLLKRFIAEGFDIVLLFIIFLLLTMVIMKTPLAATYNQHAEQCRMIELQALAEANQDKVRAAELLNGNDTYRNELFVANLHSYLLKGLAAFIAETVLFLIVPLSNRSRATLGRYLCGVGLFNERRQTYATWYQVISRFAFIFIIESMTLYLWTGIYTFLLVPVLRFITLMLNRNNKTICDYLTGTKLIEKLSYNAIN